MANDVAPVRMTCADGREVVLRVATPEDAATLLHHIDELLVDGEGQVMDADERTISVEEEQQWIADMLMHPDQLLLVVVCRDRIVGNIDFRVGSRRRLAHDGIIGMALAPDFRGIGLGTFMLETLIAWADRHPNLERLSLNVLANNPRAQRLYHKLGFVEEGRRRRFIKYGPNRYTDDILMCRMKR
jgi:RimJ/RimL family protein N-acetyltransferase